METFKAGAVALVVMIFAAVVLNLTGYVQLFI